MDVLGDEAPGLPGSRPSQESPAPPLRVSPGERHRPRARASRSDRADRTACRPCADYRSRARRPAHRATRARRPHRPACSQTTRCRALVAGRTLRAKVLPLTEAPDDAAREEHRAPRPRSLLVARRGAAPSSRARAAADRPAMPAPAMTTAARIPACARRTRCARAPAPTRRPHACSLRRRRCRRCRAPRPRRCARIDRVDEDCEMVQQRLVGLARITGMELDVRAADLDARMPVGDGSRDRSRAPCTPRPSARGSAEYERDVVEVVLDVGRRFDELHTNTFPELELGARSGRHVLRARGRRRAARHA